MSDVAAAAACGVDGCHPTTILAGPPLPPGVPLLGRRTGELKGEAAASPQPAPQEASSGATRLRRDWTVMTVAWLRARS